MEDKGFSSGSVLVSFLLGGIVGAGVALLLTPQTGEETRKKLKEFSDEVKDKTSELVDQTKHKVTDLVDEGKEMLGENSSILKAAVDAGKDAFEKGKERLSKA